MLNFQDNIEEFEIIIPNKKKNNKKKNVSENEILTIQNFSQSQSHGLFWDNEIRVKVFGLNQCKNDTKKYDIDFSENKFDPNENISIKTTCNNNICCGDIIRFYNGSFDKKYTIILIRYLQTQDKKEIKEIIEINYTQALRDYLFGTITEDILKQYVDFIKSIPNGIVTPEINSEYKKQKTTLQKEHKMFITINPKVDSNSQRRVQCTIPKIDYLLDKFPELIISRTKTSVIRGITISSEIQSSPRVRHKK